jgi:hypothetical protein
MNKEQLDDLVDRLRRECVEAVDGDTGETEFDEALLHELPSFVADRGVGGDQVQATIDMLTASSEHVTSDDRQHLIEAAKRGTRFRQRALQPLQIVLESARAELRLEAREIAVALDLGVDEVNAYEAGNRPLTKLLPVTLAKWVTRVDVPTDIAEVAIKRSLSLAEVGPRFGKRPRQGDEAGVSAENFIAAFLDALHHLRSTDAES